MRVGFISDFDFYTDGTKVFVNRCAPLFSALARATDGILYLGRLLPVPEMHSMSELDTDKFAVVSLRTRKRGMLLDTPLVAWRIWASRKGADVFVLKMGNLHAFVGFWVLKAAHRPVVCYAINDVVAERSTGYESGLRGALSRAAHRMMARLHRLMFRWADGRAALTPTIGRSLIDDGEYVVYVESPLHESDIETDVQLRNVAEPITEILSVGRLVPYKGHEYLIRAVHGLLESGVPVRLTVVGEGEERSRLERLCCELGIADSVTFAGHVSDVRALWAQYRRADLFVLPSTMEALGLVILEAMAFGVPVIASRVGGIPDVIEHEVNGFLVQPGDCAALETAVRYLVDHPVSRASMISAGLATASAFTIERQMPVLLEYLSRLVHCHCDGVHLSDGG